MVFSTVSLGRTTPGMQMSHYETLRKHEQKPLRAVDFDLVNPRFGTRFLTILPSLRNMKLVVTKYDLNTTRLQLSHEAWRGA